MITTNGVSLSNLTIQNGENGVYLTDDSSGNRITKNTVVNNSNLGIKLGQLKGSNNNVISGNNISSNGYGIYAIGSNNTISFNEVSNNEFGIHIDHSCNNTVIGNIATNNTIYNFGLFGNEPSHFQNSIDTSNLVDGKPIYFLENVADTVYDSTTNAGTVYLINCANITLKDLTITKNLFGVFLWNTSRSRIENVTATNNYWAGITCDDYSDNDAVVDNILSNNQYEGLYTLANNSVVSGNKFLDNSIYGIEIISSNTTITDNGISGSEYGICGGGTSNKFINNNLTSNMCAFRQGPYANCFNNSIFHNDFINNYRQVEMMDKSVNHWDNGYPSGGNYWSDYNGTDYYSGINQDGLGNDGIGDIPYSINGNNTDSYPLMVPWGTTYASYDWPMLLHDPLHTGFTKDSLSLPLRLKWNTTLPDLEDPTIYSSPVVQGDYLYLGGKGRFYALNASDGEILWNETMTDWVCGSPAVSGGLVYVGSDKLYAFDAQNGTLVWSYAGGDSSYCSPTVAYGNVYATAGSAVLALRADTGKPVWSYGAGDVFYVDSPAVSDRIVYIGGFDYNVYALDAFNGSVLWKSRTSGFIDFSPSINDGIVYVAGHIGGNSGWNGPGILYAFNASDGTQLWNRMVGRIFAGTPAVVDGMVYVGDEDGNFYALNGSNGQIIWKDDFSASMAYSSPAFVNNVLFVAVNTLDTLYAVNATDGGVLWNCTARSLIDDSPAVAGKTLYFGDCNSTVYAYESDSTFHAIPGDINGDLKVSLADLVLLANAYGSKPGAPNWNPDADIDGNGAVGLSDLVILALDYGKHYP
jgi:parallel beta-helix repeat protein